jgi:hypothetical protein
VDLVFVRSDKILTACEIKYSAHLKPASIIKAFEQNVWPFNIPFLHMRLKNLDYWKDRSSK